MSSSNPPGRPDDNQLDFTVATDYNATPGTYGITVMYDTAAFLGRVTTSQCLFSLRVQ